MRRAFDVAMSRAFENVAQTFLSVQAGRRRAVAAMALAFPMAMAAACGSYPEVPDVPDPTHPHAFQAPTGDVVDFESPTIWAPEPRETIAFAVSASPTAEPATEPNSSPTVEPVPSPELVPASSPSKPVCATARGLLGLQNADEVVAIARGDTVQLLIPFSTWYEYERTSAATGMGGGPITDPWIVVASTSDERKTPVESAPDGGSRLLCTADAGFAITALWVGAGREKAIDVWAGTANGLLMSWTLENPAAALRGCRRQRTTKLDGPRLHLLGESVVADMIRGFVELDETKLAALTRAGDVLIVDRRDRRISQRFHCGLWNGFAMGTVRVADRPRLVIGGRHPSAPLVVFRQSDAGGWVAANAVELPDLVTSIAPLPGGKGCIVGTLKSGAFVLAVSADRVELTAIPENFGERIESVVVAPTGDWLAIGTSASTFARHLLISDAEETGETGGDSKAGGSGETDSETGAASGGEFGSASDGSRITLRVAVAANGPSFADAPAIDGCFIAGGTVLIALAPDAVRAYHLAWREAGASPRTPPPADDGDSAE